MSRNNKRRYNGNTQKKTNNIPNNLYKPKKANDLKDIVTGNNILRIKRKCKPGETNINGVTYTVDSYTDVMNKKIIPMIEKKLLSCEIFFNNGNPYENFIGSRFGIIDPSNSSCNKVISICDEYVEVEFSDIGMYKIIKEAITSNKVSADMRYFGEVKEKSLYDVTQISAFDIIVVGDYPYKDYTSYIAYINNKEN